MRFDSGSIEPAAQAALEQLDEQYAPRDFTRPTMHFDAGRVGTAKGSPSFWVKGINLCHTGYSFYEGWTTAWDRPFTLDCVDRIADLGANTMRFVGNGRAYAQNPAQYKSRFREVMEKARSRQLKVIFALITVGDGPDDVGMAWSGRYDTLVPDLMDGYIGDPMILGWDVGNELRCHNDADHVAVSQHIAGLIRAVDPTAKVTSSMGGPGADHTAAVDAWVDFHDVHTYQDPSRVAFTPQKFDVMRYATNKPILFGEFGANVNPGIDGMANGGPRIPDEYARSHIVRAMLRYAVGGDLMGVMVWSIRDVLNNQFGLYKADGSPSAMIQEFVKFPSVRLDAAKEYTDHRYIPVVYDNFTRANSATVVGAPPIGPAPSDVKGTFGISNKRLYAAANNPGYPGVNLILWDAHVSDCRAEVEWEAGPGNTMVGVVFRYVDDQNFFMWQYKPATGGCRLILFQDGVAQDLTPPIDAPVTGAWGNPVPASLPLYGRLSAEFFDQEIILRIFDRKVIYCPSDKNLTGTKHGVMVGLSSEDAGSRITKFAVEAPLRYY